MARERKIVGIWPAPAATDPQSAPADEGSPASVGDSSDRIEEAPAPEIQTPVAAATPSAEAIWDDSGSMIAEADNRGWPWAAMFALLLGTAWVAGAAAWASRGFTVVPPVGQWPVQVAVLAAPLCFILLGWIAFDRGSQRSVQRHLRLLGAVRAEQQALTERLALAEQNWRAAHDALGQRADALAQMADDSASRITAAGQEIDQRLLTLDSSSKSVLAVSTSAMSQLESLGSALPKIEDIANRISETVKQSGQSAYQYGGQLEERIAALQAEATEARAAMEAGAQAIEERAAVLGDVSERIAAGSGEAAGKFGAMIDSQREAVLAMLADLATQMEQNLALIEERARETGANASAAVSGQTATLVAAVSESEDKVSQLVQRIAEAEGNVRGTAQVLQSTTQEFREQAAGVETDLHQRIARMARGIADVQTHVAALAGTTGQTAVEVGQLTTDAQALMEAMTRAVHNAHQGIPDALAMLDERLEQNRQRLEALMPVVDAHLTAAEAAQARWREAGTLLDGQQQTLASIENDSAKLLAGQSESLGRLQADVASLAQAMAAIRDEHAPALGKASEEAERLARAAAERAREAIDSSASDSAAAIEQAIGAAIDAAAGEATRSRIADISAVADQAVAAANAASDRLMRQLITIADSSAAIEARVAEASEALRRDDRDSLARQMAVASEALQSTAVDMTRILSTEVSDQAWEAYLKGDRSIFARRALRLLTSSEAKDVLARYQSDEDFRGLVNRYVHDFEAMLRGVMDSRDGSALSVTLLSSDIGKVYVALAQAIERLRG